MPRYRSIGKVGPMTCGSCGKALPEATARRRFCGNACRARYRRERLAKTIAQALEEARKALQRAVEVTVSRKERGGRP